MTAFPCCQCPEPPSYDPEVDDPLPKYRNKCGCPTATLECVSSEKVATLCGFSEYIWNDVDPPILASSPPKKYLKQNRTLSKNDIKKWDCCAGTPALDFTTLLTTFKIAEQEYTFPGCVVNSTLQPGERTDSDYDCGALVDTTTIAPDETGISYTVQNRSTVGYQQLEYFTVDFQFGDCSGSTFREVNNFATWTLSEEDTEADALARATATAGTACSSIYELRTTSFSFTVRTATYSVTANNLCKGRAYEGCVRLQRREAYSGTEPEGADTEWEDIEPDTIASFTATAKEMEIETDVALPGGTDEAIGYEYRAASAHVWPVSAGCDCPTDYTAP